MCSCVHACKCIHTFTRTCMHDLVCGGGGLFVGCLTSQPAGGGGGGGGVGQLSVDAC